MALLHRKESETFLGEDGEEQLKSQTGVLFDKKLPFEVHRRGGPRRKHKNNILVGQTYC